MSRVALRVPFGRGGFPRASGDEPRLLREELGRMRFSPRERG